METVRSITKIVFALTILAVIGYHAYWLTALNCDTAAFVRVIVGGGLNSREEFALTCFILSALAGPGLVFLLFLSLFSQEWRDPRTPEGLRARAETLRKEADAVEQYRAQRSRTETPGVL